MCSCGLPLHHCYGRSWLDCYFFVSRGNLTMGEIARMEAYRCFESESKDMLETAPARAVEGSATRGGREPDAPAGSIAAMGCGR
jgi:hypothetical protein